MFHEREVAEDVHVVNQHGLSVMEEGECLDDAATRVHQQAPFIGDIDVGREIVCFEESDDLVAVMVDIDDDGVETLFDEVFDIVLQQRLSGDFDECFGTVLGLLLEPCAQPCGKNHGGFIHGCFVRYG